MERRGTAMVAMLGLALGLTATGCRMPSRRVPPEPRYAPANGAPPPAGAGFSMAPGTAGPGAYAGSVGALDPSGMPNTGINPYTGGPAASAPGAGSADGRLSAPGAGSAPPLGGVAPTNPAPGYNMGGPGTGPSPL